MVQVPAARPVTVLSLTVQTLSVADVKIIAGPEALEEVALTVPVPPTATLGAAPKVMVWLPLGITAELAAEAVPVPALLVAVTVKVYAVPLVKPVTTQLNVLPLAVVQVLPSGLEVAV